MSEIHSTVPSMKNNKAPCLNDIPTENFKVFFNFKCNTSYQNDPSQKITYYECVNCLFLLYNKI